MPACQDIRCTPINDGARLYSLETAIERLSAEISLLRSEIKHLWEEKDSEFNAGVEAVASHLDEEGEHELASGSRTLKREV